MFTTTFVYLMLTFLIFWAYCGYFLTLYLLSLFGDTKSPNQKEDEKVTSRVSLLIPCFNEEGLVFSKGANIRDLDYPKELLDIYFLDGSSTDKTVERLKEETKDMSNVKVIETGCRGKISQINSVLPNLNLDIVVITDMDAIMEKDTLLKLVRVLENEPEVAVAGAHVIPRSTYRLELQYWQDQNLMRFLEGKVYSSSIVVAPCYAFRSILIKRFPDDCIADDIYISFLANVKGQRSKYIEEAMVYETRTPSNLEELLRHKFRKGNAYIMELLRFLYMLPVMPPKWKVIYCSKFIQVIVIPWIIPFFILSTISQVLSGIGYIKLPGFAFVFLFLSLFTTHLLFSKSRTVFSNEKYKRRSSLAVFFITNFILLINGLTFPFYRQTSSYSKINTNTSKNKK